MKIVIEPGGWDCLNIGDLAMLEAACSRLWALWPAAHIHVITTAPERLCQSIPRVQPLSPQSRFEVLNHQPTGGALGSPSALQRARRAAQNWIRRQAPAVDAAFNLARVAKQGDAWRPAAALLWTIRTSDLFVLSGAGGINDAFAAGALRVLLTLRFAQRGGRPTALLGHMIGPLTHPAVLQLCRDVLPRTDWISLREGFTSLPVLHSLGVPSGQIAVCGDETVEMAYNSRQHGGEKANRLGWNVRVARYSGLQSGDEAWKAFRSVVAAAAGEFQAEIAPIAISHQASDSDQTALEQITAGLPCVAEAAAGPESSEEVFRRVGACRVVVTGSYHGAVFALAQGIPAVGLSFTPYYQAKFDGLRDLFGGGCRHVDGTVSGWPEALRQAIDELWTSAPQWQKPLCEAAARQARLSWQAYAALAERIRARRRIPAALPLSPPSLAPTPGR
ncbi:MAG TPA: polysaccharide pyruvyl transferase family protein [Bryobacterales bacterium]|nr:polysaccharide pyruvyl transferase family protein [Bryobacterales bacterium]